MQDNKEWNNIRDNVVDVFDENNTFNQAKEFSNKALDILRRVGNPIQYNKNVNVNTVPKKVKEKKKYTKFYFSRSVCGTGKICKR